MSEISKDYKEVSVIAWPVFKQQIYDLYESRIKDNWEVVGSITNSIVPFEEYITLFFTKLYSHRRLAELKTLEFLSSLKYYSEVFPRAYVCSLMCNLIVTHKFGMFNIFLQNYFLFVISHMMELKD